MPMGYRIYKLKCDPGGEFSGIFREFCSNNAIEIHQSPAAAHQLNGIAERASGVHAEMARSMMIWAQRPTKWWYWCLDTATYLSNRLPTSANEGSMSPHEKLTGLKYDYNHARVWGCAAYKVLDTKPGLRVPVTLANWPLDVPGAITVLGRVCGLRGVA